ncbi:MAG TPA: TIGR03915 family putative DNA repair protein [Acetobacteraceae bacterium]|nr:TIGR03915 family putative DNA repair protein [Acetobacteraceae bacterium]
MPRQHVEVGPRADVDGFRRAVRLLIARDVPPDHVTWGEEASLVGAAPDGDGTPLVLPRAVVELIERVACHSNPERYALLYQLVWRVHRGERALLEVASDPLVHRLQRLSQAVQRDIHKMHAFLRFRDAGDGHLVAWFEPEHHILAAAAQFFIDRFGALVWSIITPRGSLHWDREKLVCGPPGRRCDVPPDDAFEAGWRGYYESVFNPARANPQAMRLHMPKKYWRNMPETAAIPDLLRSAQRRVAVMMQDGEEA